MPAFFNLSEGTNNKALAIDLSTGGKENAYLVLDFKNGSGFLDWERSDIAFEEDAQFPQQDR